MTSQSSVQTASFWKTIGSVHQSPMSPRPPSPGVVEIDQGRADGEDDELDEVEQVDAVGVPKPLTAQSWASGLIRVEVRLRLPLVEVERRRCR